ncbi:hypothetical protein PhCBS80983_g04886 [Powellomyces hirtus]|uniref:OPT superfamily oligopeptide transporter n=1 Tax=Powellomyces hirtus TaxID=109895 RepID=A0A507DXR3_9FUNG|nr:hypothetical protein PhCBS80983_g04886 [Powellomyces hirtus]
MASMIDRTSLHSRLGSVPVAIEAVDPHKWTESKESPYGDDAPPKWIESDFGHFTIRASIIGSLLGCFVAASNFYLGLKVGWTFGAQLFSAVFTFGILKTVTRALSTKMAFTPQENCTAQTAASTTGGLSVGFITGIPAMYRLGLMSDDVMNDVGRLTMWTIAAASYGLFFAVPLRRHFVVNKDLPFPTPRATAVTIKALHKTSTSQEDAMKTIKVMSWTFAISLGQTLVSYWVYFLDKIHIFYWIGRAAGNVGMQNADTVWGWHFVPNFAFVGAGLVTPPATLLSFLAGSLVAFGIGGPVMYQDGYLSNPLGWGKKGNGSAQSWWFWPGIALMLFSAFAELGVHYKEIALGTKSAVTSSMRAILDKVRHRRHGQQAECSPITADASGYELNRENPKMQVPGIWWTGGLCVAFVWTCAVLSTFFAIPVYQSLLSVVFAFFLGIVGIQATAETDINPISTLAKVVQLAFVKFPASSVQEAQRNNILSAAVTSAAANQAADMVGDLKTGYLVGASPRSQFLAQLIGTTVAVPVNLGLFLIFSKAYPCILKPMDICEFGLSPVLGWENFTLLLTTNAGIPRASWITAIACAVFAIAFTVAKHKMVPARYHVYMPSISALGLGMIVPQPSTPLAMCLAMLGGLVWRKVSPITEKHYRIAVASGAIAGVGVAAVMRAILKLSEVQDKTVRWNCPYDAKGAVKCLA